MPFPFTHLVDLLEPLSTLSNNSKKSPAALQIQYSGLIHSWFAHHRPLFASTSLDPIALFSLLFPELRSDRVYNLKEDSLVKIIARCLGLGTTRHAKLSEWRRLAGGDLGEMVGRVMKEAENPAPPTGKEVTVEEIENALEKLSRRSAFSSQSKRAASESLSAHSLLQPIFLRITSTEGKWLTRAILKNYLPLEIPQERTMEEYHFLLPHLFAFQNDLRKALGVLQTPVFKIFPPCPEGRDREGLLEGAALLVRPEVGTRIGRVGFVKARSCKNAMQLAGNARMAMERKYDGEYCQIHIDLSKGDNWIKIFSKSGRDSTQDREAIHSTIREALNIDNPKERHFKRQCILEGELLVYSEKEQRIMEFYHLRSHVNRSGVYIGTKKDARPDFTSEHLMLVLYDILLLDTQPLLSSPYDRRRTALETLLPHQKPGHCILSTYYEIDFSSPSALKQLRERFAEGIVRRWEGFVLKPCEAAYLDFGGGGGGGGGGVSGKGWGNRRRRAEFIKLKKDYIRGLGDTGDFVVVGAGWERERGLARGVNVGSVGKSGGGGIGGLTTFFVGTVMDKERIVRFNTRPVFKVLFHVSYSILKQDLEHINRLAYFRAKEYDKSSQPPEFDLHLSPNLPPMSVYFPIPFVFELTGAGFDKPSDTDHYILRWPRVVKIHWDREWTDALGFEEVQEMAGRCVNELADGEEEVREEREWVRRLEEGDGVGGGRGRGRKRGLMGSGGVEGEEEMGGAAGRVLRRRVTAPEGMAGAEGRGVVKRALTDGDVRLGVLGNGGDKVEEMQDMAQDDDDDDDGGEVLETQRSQSSEEPSPILPHPPPPPLPRRKKQLQPQQPPTPQQAHPTRPILNPLPTPTTPPNTAPPRPPIPPPTPSPLTNTTILLPPFLLPLTRLTSLLPLHNPSSIHPASSLATILSQPSPPHTIILLIDTRTSRKSKAAISEVSRVLEQLARPGTATPITSSRLRDLKVHVYDWHVVGHSDAAGKERLDLLDKGRGKERKKEKGGEAGDENGGGGGMKDDEKNMSRRKRKVDWDLFYMLTL